MKRLAALLVLLALISTAFAMQTDNPPLSTSVIDENTTMFEYSNEFVILKNVSGQYFIQVFRKVENVSGLVDYGRLSIERLRFLEQDYAGQDFFATISFKKPLAEQKLAALEANYDATLGMVEFVSSEGSGVAPWPPDQETMRRMAQSARESKYACNQPYKDFVFVVGYISARASIPAEKLEELAADPDVLFVDVGAPEFLEQYPNAAIIPGTDIYYEYNKSVSTELPAQDNAAPVVTITSPAAQDYSYSAGLLAFDYSVKDDRDLYPAVSVKLDGQNLTSGEADLDSLGLGAHTLAVSATDDSGNSKTQTVTFKVVDDVPPASVAQTTGQKGNDNWYVGDVTVLVNATDEKSGVARVEYELERNEQLVETGDYSFQDGIIVTAEGKTTVRFRAIDAAGNVEEWNSLDLFIDKTPPITTLSSGVTYNNGTAEFANASVSYALTAEDNVSGVAKTEVSVDEGEFAEYSEPISFETEGMHFISFKSTDKAGNVEEPRTYVVFVDSTPPDTIIEISGPKFASETQTFITSESLLGLVSADLGAGVRQVLFKTDDGDWQEYSQAFSVEVEGKHAVEYYGVDNVGNSEQAQAFGFVVDNTPPATTDDAPEGWVNEDVSVALSAVDAAAGVAQTLYCVDQSDDCVPETEGSSVVVSEEGTNFIKYYSIDNLENAEQTHSATVRIDKTAPATSDDAPEGWQKQDFTISLVAADELSGVAQTYYRVDEGEWSTGTQVVISAEGDHKIEYYSTDNAGNSEGVREARAKLDKTPPVTTDDVVSDWTNKDVVVTLTPTDALSGVANTYFRVNDGEWNEGTSITLAETGEFVVEYYSTDAVGNAEQAKSATVRVDKTPPATSDDAPEGWQKQDFTINLAATDEHSGVAETYYRIDEGEWNTGPQVLVSEEGNHKIEYYSTDNAGNSEQTKETRAKLDKTPPTTTDDAASGWTNQDVLVTLTPVDAGSGVAQAYYRVNEEDWAEGTSVLLSETGEYVVEYYSVDVAGNQEQTRTSATVQIDKQLPVVSITEPAEKEYSYTESFVVGFEASDEHSGVASASALLDGEEVENGETVSLFGYAVGEHSLVVTATDNAGNSASQTVMFTIIDDVAPQTTDDHDTDWHNSDVTITLTADDEKSDVAEVHYVVNGGEEKIVDVDADGSAGDPFVAIVVIGIEGENNSVEYWAVDEYGNTEERRVTDQIKLDKTAPATTQDYDGAWHASDFSIALSASDELSGVADVYYVLYYAGESQGTKTVGADGQPFVTFEDNDTKLEFWAVDVAGNEEGHQTLGGIRLDKTAPQASAWLDPALSEYNSTELLPFKYSVSDPVVQGQPSGIASQSFDIDGAAIQNPDSINVSDLLGSHTLTVSVTDNAGNSASASVDFAVVLRLVGEDQLKITPETLKINPGVMTAHVNFPAPYNDSATTTILNATLDGAKEDNIADFNIKFRRQDVEDALNATGQELDTHFDVRGWFRHNNAEYVFVGEDNITKISND